MATDLKTSVDGVALTRFWGGTERGVCVQVSAGYNKQVGLTRAEAEQLAEDLLAFAREEEVVYYGA